MMEIVYVSLFIIYFFAIKYNTEHFKSNFYFQRELYYLIYILLLLCLFHPNIA